MALIYMMNKQEKKGLISINDYSLSSPGTFKEKILEVLKKPKYDDVEDLIYRFQITYDENTDILDLEYIPKKNRLFPKT